jgi:hypothetical protein
MPDLLDKCVMGALGIAVIAMSISVTVLCCFGLYCLVIDFLK